MAMSDCSKNQLGESDAESASSGPDDSSKSTSTNQNSSENRSTTDSHRTAATDEDIQTIRDALTKQDTAQVFRLRVLVIFILVAAATSVSLTVFYITRTADKEEFELQYYGVADKIIEHFQEIMVQMSAVSGLAVAATTHAEQEKHWMKQFVANLTDEDLAGLDWPFVTLPHFQERAGNVREISGAIYVSINPIVQADQLSLWEDLVHGDANQWIDEGLEFQDGLGLNYFDDPTRTDESKLTRNKIDPLHTHDADGVPHLSMSKGPFLPRWQTSPVLESSMVNENLFEMLNEAAIARKCIESKSAVLGGFVTAPPGNTSHPDPETSFFATLRSISEGRQAEYLGDPMSNLVIPIFDRLSGQNRKVVAVLQSTIHWRWYLRDLLPETNHGVMVVLENACEGNFTYHLVGSHADVVGFGDQHDPEYSEYHYGGSFLTEVIEDGTAHGIPLNQKECPYSFHIYGTAEDLNYHKSNDPIIISVSVAAVFLFTIGMFFTYDHLVERRQKLVLAKATQSTAIVSSLFPKQVRDRLMAVENDRRKGDAMLAPNARLKTFLNGSVNGSEGDQPIADFFPNCTVFFADIAGFTAWSSTREPAQVFILLQTVYANFDIIAKRRRVFKVETIGDTYLAVTGLPEPQSHHATIMARFAWDCLVRVGEIAKELEVSLGPDTGDLSMRFGLHSGSVTAGVLKGDRARFQLFGDTVNTAARMEGTGSKGRIQVSESTAKSLKKAGKGSWLTRREDVVDAKGKGVLKTYWLTLDGEHAGSSGGSIDEQHTEYVKMLRPSHIDLQKRHNLKESRLVDWVSDILLEHIKKIVIVHERCPEGCPTVFDNLHYEAPDGQICLDEVKQSIAMPRFNARVTDATLDSNLVEIPADIVDALREYVTLIAKAYHENPFHNFEHACHVTMSVNKLLSRIVAPDLANPKTENFRRGRNEVAAEIHDFTHGITSDPLAIFAITFSALIHDVDHQGISNVQLAKEDPEMGEMYRNKSVAEQNSFDVAWDMLMSKRFDRLRQYIFVSRVELLRFRQLIVNVVLATDIFDKELNQLRKHRWERAFHKAESLPRSRINNMRATIVMEHIIQASDVSHTMQHWHVYQKWNRKLFGELYRAWKAGRMGADPSTFWYKGELGFFDNYIIPLAKKLKECNVFGVSSDEYLGYAERNRAEWEERGEQILERMIQECDEEDATRAISNHDTQSVDATVSIHSNSSGTPAEEIV